MQDTVIVSDKRFLKYLVLKNQKPISAKRVNSQVQFTYLNDENFKSAQLDFMVDKDFQAYESASKVIEEMLRTVN